MPEPGTRVIVPLMAKEVRGVVLREHTEPIAPALATKIRPYKQVIDAAPVVMPSPQPHPQVGKSETITPLDGAIGQLQVELSPMITLFAFEPTIWLSE